MKLELRLFDDNGSQLMELITDKPWQPAQWKCAPNNPVTCVREGENGAYLIYCFTVQPTVTLNLAHGRKLNPDQIKIY